MTDLQNYLSKHEIKELMLYPAWKQFAKFFIVILTYFFLFSIVKTSNIFISIVAWWFQGFLLVCCFNVIHDCAHKNFVQDPRFCNWFGVILATMLLVNFSIFKSLHLDHHRFTNMPNDTQRPRDYQNLWQYLIAIPHWKFPIRTFTLSFNSLRNIFPSSVRSRIVRSEVIRDTYFLFSWVILIVACSIIYPLIMLELYLVPIFFYFSMIFFVTATEHSRCDKTDDKTRNTRSIISNPLLRFFSNGFNFHAEHHLYPAIPSPQLIHVNRKIGKYLKYNEKSYFAFHLKLIFSLIKGTFNKQA